MTEYSSHDWRKNTDDAIVVDTQSKNEMKVKHAKFRTSFVVQLLRD